MWRSDDSFSGPVPATHGDIDGLNRVFSEAFTERYRRDGLAGVRVPFLNPAVWQFAIDDAGDGAMTWRDARGEIAAFNMVHRSGSEGWMGPLAVRNDRQGHGHGQEIVRAGVEWLRAQGVRTIGLETMPRTIDNIGFYSRLGFVPDHLTVTVQRDRPRQTGRAGELLEDPRDPQRKATVAECVALAHSLVPGIDFTREIELTIEQGLGGVSLVRDASRALCGFALWHSAPLAQGRAREELRILKLAATHTGNAMLVVDAAEREAANRSLGRLALRCQTRHTELYAALIQDGFRVQWTDLRMTLADARESDRSGVLLSNWEI